mmetsp:Transcript_5200/g.4387  ORF Transcript_5200/g.4387 Transcript_5200/m.4387 type:complete len:236 (+) Transcript_5200:630-1337(+)
MFTLNKNIDLNNIENPIQDLLKTQSFNVKDSKASLVTEIDIRKSKYMLDDGYWPWSSIEQNEYFSISNYRERYYSKESIPDTNIISFKINLDFTEDYYERKVLKLLEVTGQLGGIFELYETIGGFIIGWISSKILNKEIQQHLMKSELIYLKNLEILQKLQSKEKEESNEEVKEEHKINTNSNLNIDRFKKNNIRRKKKVYPILNSNYLAKYKSVREEEVSSPQQLIEDWTDSID